jgi:uncharacterized protein (TIGR02145 family)
MKKALEFMKFPLLFVFIGLLLFSACQEDDDNPTPFEKGTLTDIDGNVYTTIKIGNQWWMMENLKVKTFRDGTPITDGQSASVWLDTTASYCLFDNNTTAPGLLYNWKAINATQNLAPAGWHIPTDQEWKTLEKYLGMSQSDADRSGWRGTTEGNELKLPGLTGWSSYGDNWPDNSSGFSASAGGCRLPTAVFGDPALFSSGFWWTNSAKDDTTAYFRYLDYKTSTVFRSAVSKSYGFSVRCVKD